MFFDFTHLAPYILIVFSLVATPGPDSILIIRNTLGSGYLVGLAAVAGVQIGLAVHTTFAITGISIAIRASQFLFNVVVVLGSLYLLWLGLRACIAPSSLIDLRVRQTMMQRSFSNALITNIFNPKAIILFLAVMPSFVIEDANLIYQWQLIFLAIMLLVVNTIWQSLLVFGANYASTKLSSNRFINIFNRGCGALLIFFGAFLFVENIHVF